MLFLWHQHKEKGLGLRLRFMLKDPGRIQKSCRLLQIASSAAVVKMSALSFVRQACNMSVLVQHFPDTQPQRANPLGY